MAKIHGSESIPESHAALMGRLADAWAQFEFAIDQGIWELVNIEQQLTACVTSQFISIHPRMKAFIALVEVQGGTQKAVANLKKFYGNVSGLSETRNRRIHDPRYRDRTTGQIHRLEITAKPAVQFGFLPEPESEPEAIINEIYERGDEFIELRNSVISEIYALPPESQPSLLRIIALPKSPQDPPSE